jgi:hypothetical protein
LCRGIRFGLGRGRRMRRTVGGCMIRIRRAREPVSLSRTHSPWVSMWSSLARTSHLILDNPSSLTNNTPSCQIATEDPRVLPVFSGCI